MTLNELKSSMDKIPTTIPEAIKYLYSELPPESIEFAKNNDSASIHHTAGRALRNDWNLWNKESPLNKDFCERYGLFGHGDDISGIIYCGLWAKIRGEDMNEAIKKEVEVYKNHWTEMGLDPKTGEETGKPKKTDWVIEVIKNKLK